ncbi:MAG TPA: LUD domain-containing protein [Hyphomicrobium sp.]|nr:LUD domain-containing protein [Hyphomicrobium sp.]
MSRDTIIARVKSALQSGGESASKRSNAVKARLSHQPRHPLPAFAALEGEERVAQFIRSLETQGAEVIAVPEFAILPVAVEQCLERVAPRPRFVIGNDERLITLAWPTTPELWRPDQMLGDGTAALTHAWGAVAETGTLVMSSSAASPASLAFLPELHIVALARGSIVGSFEEAFGRLGASSAGRLPRAVNLVSSPSRTSDIGGRSVRGAHGPRRLAVIIYG